MPADLITPIATPSEVIPDFDKLEIINVNVVTHLQKLNEPENVSTESPLTRIESIYSGNIEIGDQLEIDGSGDIVFETKLAIHYVLLLANVIVYRGVLDMNDPEFNAEPTSTGFTSTLDALTYKFLKDNDVIPQNALVS